MEANTNQQHKLAVEGQLQDRSQSQADDESHKPENVYSTTPKSSSHTIQSGPGPPSCLHKPIEGGNSSKESCNVPQNNTKSQTGDPDQLDKQTHSDEGDNITSPELLESGPPQTESPHQIINGNCM